MQYPKTFVIRNTIVCFLQAYLTLIYICLRFASEINFHLTSEKRHLSANTIPPKGHACYRSKRAFQESYCYLYGESEESLAKPCNGGMIGTQICAVSRVLMRTNHYNCCNTDWVSPLLILQHLTIISLFYWLKSLINREKQS